MLNNLRKAVSFLSYEEEGIINEIIIKEKSIISFAISLNISEFELLYRIEEALSLKPNQTFLVSKYRTQSEYFSQQELKQILEAFINLDSDYKKGIIDINIGLDSILCSYCS